MAATKIRGKIERLNALINHPRTGEAERDAAIRMLARLQAKAGTAAAAHSSRRVYGSKYDKVKGFTRAEIAKLIREDIKLARKISKQVAEPGALKTVDPIGDSPAGIRFSVRTENYSGGGSIDVFIRNIPSGWGFELQKDDWGEPMEMPTPALRSLAKELKKIMDAYNYDGSDITTDYFDVRFYGSVMTAGGRILA